MNNELGSRVSPVLWRLADAPRADEVAAAVALVGACRALGAAAAEGLAPREDTVVVAADVTLAAAGVPGGRAGLVIRQAGCLADALATASRAHPGAADAVAG